VSPDGCLLTFPIGAAPTPQRRSFRRSAERSAESRRLPAGGIRRLASAKPPIASRAAISVIAESGRAGGDQQCGTGPHRRDGSPEAVRKLCSTKHAEGFGELFRVSPLRRSYQQPARPRLAGWHRHRDLRVAGITRCGDKQAWDRLHQRPTRWRTRHPAIWCNSATAVEGPWSS